MMPKRLQWNLEQEYYVLKAVYSTREKQGRNQRQNPMVNPRLAAQGICEYFGKC